MKNTLHLDNSDVRQHLLVNKSSAINIKPNIIYTGELKKNDDFAENMHAHDFCEIMFMRSGTCNISIDNKFYTVKEGDIIIYNPNVMHHELGGEGLSIIFFAINKFKIDDLPDNYFLQKDGNPIVHTANYKHQFDFYFTELFKEAYNQKYCYEQISKQLVRIILNLLLRILTETNDSYFKTNETYQKIKDYIDQNFLQINDMDLLCNEVHVSRFYLTHLFKSYSGMSPLKYIICKKINKAKQLLVDTKLPLAKIAEQLGYQEVNSFVKTFKKNEGITPYQYRCTHKKI